MGNKQAEADSVGQAKPLPFGATLRRAIKQEFGTGKEFAARLGVSEGRVSQFLSGAESLTPQTLKDISSAFANLADQEDLHRSWVATFAPAPLHSLDRWDLEDAAHQLLASQTRLMASGRATQALNALQAIKPRIQDSNLRFTLQRSLIETALFLGRSQQAQRLAKELTATAKAENEMGWTAQGLWLEATADRTAPAIPVRKIAQTHDVAAQYLAAWSPLSKEAKELRTDLRSAIHRDRALTMLVIHEQRPVQRSDLDLVAQILDRFLDTDMRDERRAVFLEVRARVYLAKGDVLGTEDSVQEAQEVRGFVSADHEVKTNLLKGQLLFARGLPHQAETVLLEALEKCYQLDDHHHARSIERILNRNPR